MKKELLLSLLLILPHNVMCADKKATRDVLRVAGYFTAIIVYRFPSYQKEQKEKLLDKEKPKRKIES